MNRTVTTISFLSFVYFFLVAMSNAQEPANISTDISDRGSLGPWESPDLDNVEMGSAGISALIPEGTGFTVDFEGAWPDTTWNSGQQYSLNQSDGVLEVAVDKFEPWITYQYKFSGVYDVSGNPYLSVLVKADRPLVLWARIWEGTRSVARKVRVYETAGFTKYCFDFADSGNVFLGEVRMIEFGVNEDATGFNGILWMDDIKFGTDAARFASLAGINKQTYYIDSKGNSMLITDVENAVSLSTAGAESLIENISFAQEGSEAFRMSFDCIDDASGTAILTVTANGADGWGDNTVRLSSRSPVMNRPWWIRLRIWRLKPVRITVLEFQGSVTEIYRLNRILRYQPPAIIPGS